MIIIVLFILIWACIDILSLGAKYHKLPNKKVLILILAFYIIFVLYVTLLNRTMGKAIDYNFELFWSYKNMLMAPGKASRKGFRTRYLTYLRKMMFLRQRFRYQVLNFLLYA